TITFLPILLKASLKPTVTVDLPSPAGVGFIAETRTILDFSLSPSSLWMSTFALYFPYISNASSGIPAFSAISCIGCSVAWDAISWSVKCAIFSATNKYMYVVNRFNNYIYFITYNKQYIHINIL